MSGCIVVICDDGVDVFCRQVIEVGFSGEVPAEPSDGVFNTAFLPWCARVAEVGIDFELAGDALMAVELGAIVEGDRAFEGVRHGVQHPDERVGDGIGLEAALPHGDGDPRVALMRDEDRLSRRGEDHGIGFPMAWLFARCDAVGAIVDRWALGIARPASLGAPSALVFCAREIEAPAPIIGAAQLVIDEAIDGLVADDPAAFVPGQTARHLFG